MPSPLVFLSHSGADTEAARELKRRLMASPDAQKSGLKVWFDKDDLRPGTPWSAQIAEAIQNQATAFVIHVGSGGVMNWVEAEVDLALSRATTDKKNPLLFIPSLAADSGGSKALPAFAKRYQGVRDPLGNADELAKLLAAILDLDARTAPILIDEPFVGLRAMREEEADRFFGRNAETAELTEKFRRLRLVAIVADSGAGKSSLARAGFAPAFRGGALIDPAREGARDKVWHIVTMRPFADPVDGLQTGVEIAAGKLGRSQADVASLRASVSLADAGNTAFALRCGLPSDRTSTLLIVDQFEELFTATPDKDAASFAALLLALAGGASDVRILLTVRSDYFNLASGMKDAAGRPALFERLAADNNDAVVRLKTMSLAGLREAVLEPLRLAGAAGESALADAVETDISHQASDLPLLQVALRAAWQRHGRKGPAMLECYQAVGRVSGALANQADEAVRRLPPDDRARLEAIFVRLVRLGDTGGATRLGASLDDFDPQRRALLQKLAEDEYGRLVSVGASHVELAHDALITQWPWLQDMLKTNAADVRRLARLIERAKEWSAAPDDRKAGYLATGAERELFDELAGRRADWLSKSDGDFVAASEKAFQDDAAARAAEADQRRHEREKAQARQIDDANKLADAAREVAASERRASRRTGIGALVAFVFALAAGVFAIYSQVERDRADGQTQLADQKAGEAVRNQSVALTALADIEARTHPINAAKLALAGWPRGGEANIRPPKLSEALDALGRIVPEMRERRVLKGHDGSVASATFSPDGKRVVTASADNTARLWDADTGRAIVTLKGHEGSVMSAAFSPDGKRVVTASRDKTARLWDADTGREIAILKGHDGSVYSAAFSPDGKRVVTASEDSTARLWDADRGREIVTLKGHDGPVASAAFSPDGKRVVTASEDSTAHLWDADTGREIVTLKGHDGPVITAFFSPDGKRVVTASSDNTARLWDADSGREIVTLKGHNGSVISAALSPDGKRVVTASSDNTARLWDADSGREIVTLKGHDGSVISAAFSPDGKRVVTASNDKTARLWDAETGREIVTLKGHDSTANSAAFSSDGKRVVTGSNDKTARLWDAETGREIVILKGHDNFVTSAAFGPDGRRVVTASWDNTARLWDADSGREIITLKGHDGPVITAAFSWDGKRVVTASWDNTARLWDVDTGREIVTLKGHDDYVISAAFSPDGKRVVTASRDKTARLWDADTGREIVTLKGHDGSVISAAFSLDGKRVVTASRDKTARLWDADTGREIVTLKGHDDSVVSVAFSPDGQRVATASRDKTARLWDADSGREIVTLKGHDGSVVSAAFSPDGKRVVTASDDKTARLWDADSGREIVTLKGHDGSVASAVFSPDGKRVVTASDDKTARLWDADSGREIVTLKGHDGSVASAVFSPDGKRVVTASRDNTARLWDIGMIPKGNILQVACAYLRMHEHPVTLAGVTDYPLTFDPPTVCETDPPPADSLGD